MKAALGQALGLETGWGEGVGEWRGPPLLLLSREKDAVGCGGGKEVCESC